MRRDFRLVFGTFLLAGLVFALGSYSPVQSQAPEEAAMSRADFHQAAFLASLGSVSGWMDSDFGQTYFNLIQAEGFSSEEMLQFLTTFPPAMAKLVADSSVGCYFDDECEWNVRGAPWPMENPDNWYTNTMADPEVWCKFWPDVIPMWEEVFWTCLQADGVAAAPVCRTMIESNVAGMTYPMWETCVPVLNGW